MGLFSRVAGLIAGDSGIDWDPEQTPLPTTFSQSSKLLTLLQIKSSSLPLPSSSSSNVSPIHGRTIKVTVRGGYAKGTIRLMASSRPLSLKASTSIDLLGGEEALPVYSASQDADKEGEVQIRVVGRYNVQELWDESDIQLVESDETGTCEVSISTPELPSSTNISRIGANLSFHVTFVFPHTVKSLYSLSVDVKRFRIITDTLIGSIYFENLVLSTTDAPMEIKNLRGTNITLRNLNILDPTVNKTLEHTGDSIRAEAVFAKNNLIVHARDGAIAGSFNSSELLTVGTTNSTIIGVFKSAMMKISTTNAAITGDFFASDQLTITNENGKVTGNFEGRIRGVTITTKNNSIEGNFTIGNELRAITTYNKIDARIRIIGLPIPETFSEQDNDKLIAERDRDLPTFESLAISGQVEGSLSQVVRRISQTKVYVETDQAAATVVYEKHPGEIRLTSIVKASGGGQAAVSHGRQYTGSFTALTSTLSKASLVLSPQAKSLKTVVFSSEKRSEIAGTIRNTEEANGSGGKSEDRGLNEEELESEFSKDKDNGSREGSEDKMNKTMVGTVSGTALITIR